MDDAMQHMLQYRFNVAVLRRSSVIVIVNRGISLRFPLSVRNVQNMHGPRVGDGVSYPQYNPPYPKVGHWNSDQ